MDGWGFSAGDQPIPPQNGAVVSPLYSPEVLDIRWDNPAILARNAKYTVVGVNIYRSDETDRGPYHRINDVPIGGTFYRDQAENVEIHETVGWETDWIDRGDASNNRGWVLKTKHPISKKRSLLPPYQKPIPANSPSDIKLYIDGVSVKVDDVFGANGEVRLINVGTFNPATEKIEPPILPNANSAVEIVYYTNRNYIVSGLNTGLFYRLTTVVLNPDLPGQYLETDLSWCAPICSFATEQLDYIWKEGIRRNSWILQQGGERVYIYVRKQSGLPCDCGLDPRTLEYSQQPSQRCDHCFGSGFIGGYEGPFDAIIAPEDGERRFQQGPTGRSNEFSYEVWMGPSPMVTQRDFVVKQTNERFYIGPVRRPSNRGNILQQHFTISSMDEADIRYRVPIDGVDQQAWPQTRYGYRQVVSMPIDGQLTQTPSTMPDAPPYPTEASKQLPMQTNKPEWPEEKQPRGRTPAWENTSE